MRPIVAVPIVLAAVGAARAMAQPAVTILSVVADTNSVRISFAPVAGARDFRVYDVTDPMDRKYAGLAHVFAPWGEHFALAPDSPAGAANGDERVLLPPRLLPGDFSGAGFDSNDPEVASVAPFHAAIPATTIEWNGLTHGVPATLVVEAVDEPGPVPPENLTNDLNAHAVRGGGQLLAQAGGGAMPAMAMPGASHTRDQGFGADRGATPDGATSTNGQLPYCSGVAVTAHMTGTTLPAGVTCGDTAPQVIAASAPFTVVADAAPPLPSSFDATQVVYDRFDNGSFSAATVTDPIGGRASYRMTTPMAQWLLDFVDVDLDASSAFIADHHYMDVIYDGATAKRSPVVHNNHAVIALSPVPVADFSAGRILHVTFEVDAQVDGRRWFGVSLAPAADPLTSWYEFNGPINTSNQALFVQ